MVGGEKIDTLTLTDPTIGQLSGIKLPISGGFDLEQLPKMVAVVANIPPSSAEQIKVSDMVVFFERVMDFFEPADRIGELAEEVAFIFPLAAERDRSSDGARTGTMACRRCAHNATDPWG